jgi:hypothetical protein
MAQDNINKLISNVRIKKKLWAEKKNAGSFNK